MTWDLFHIAGNLLSSSERLKRRVRRGAIAGAVVFRTMGDIVSGPGALKFANDLMDLETSSVEMRIWSRRASVQGGSLGKTVFESLMWVTLVKVSLRMLDLVWGSLAKN